MSDPEVYQFMDNVDLDLVVKVASHTVFSPFFVFMVPIFYVFQGNPYTDPVITYSAIYWLLLCLYWSLSWYSQLWRNQGSLLLGPEKFDWGEQIVVITGGSSGIGELLANTLSVRNVSVVVLDVNPIVTENHNITYYKCDVSKWEEVEAVSKRIVEEIGEPTVLVNNAGVVQGKLILDLDPEDIKQTFGVNTLSHFWTVKAFLPGMLKKKSGHIITMSSVMGVAGAAQLTDYCASKAALVSLNDSLRYELDKRYKCPGIRTTLVLPGHTQTRMFSHVQLRSNPLFRFFAPSLSPITVVKAIIAAIDFQYSTTIRLPFFVHFVPFTQLLPSYMKDLFQWMSGADYAMEGFVKVNGRRPEEGSFTADEKR